MAKISTKTISNTMPIDKYNQTMTKVLIFDKSCFVKNISVLTYVEAITSTNNVNAVISGYVKFYDNNETLLKSIYIKSLNVYSHNSLNKDERIDNILIQLDNVYKIELQCTGHRTHSVARAYCNLTVNYYEDMISEILKTNVKNRILNNELIQKHIFKAEVTE